MEFEDYVGAIMGADANSCWFLRKYLGNGRYFWGYCTSDGVLNPSEEGRTVDKSRIWAPNKTDLADYYKKHADPLANNLQNKILRKIKLMSERQRFKFQECV